MDENKVFNVIMIFIAFTSIYFQVFSESIDIVRSSLYFSGLFIFLLILYLVSWSSVFVMSHVNRMETNKKEIMNIKKMLNNEKKFNELDRRLSIIESKKGDIEPKWIGLAMLLVLFYLYLRSMGVLP